MQQKLSDDARRERINAQNAAYRAANPEKVRDWNKRYIQNNLDRFRQSQREYKKKRYWTDPSYRIMTQLRARLAKAYGRGSGASAMAANCGCSPDELVAKIESQFAEGMSWDDRSSWHIDHIYPLSAVDASDKMQVLAANHWMNLRPVWAGENFSKSASVTEESRRRFFSIVEMLSPKPEDHNAAEV